MRYGGRQKGTPNKATAAKRLLAQANAAAAQGEHITALALFQWTYRDETLPLAQRLAAAKEALPYESPKLTSVDLTGEAVRRAVVRMPAKPKDLNEWLSTHRPDGATPPTMQ